MKATSNIQGNDLSDTRQASIWLVAKIVDNDNTKKHIHTRGMLFGFIDPGF
jgi:hypothetical protein